MKVHGRHRVAPGAGDHGAHWISYSDMMASLLLVFVLAVVYSVYQYYNMLELKTMQLNAQQAELDRATITLVQREEELEAANATLVGKQEELALLQIQLDQQSEELNAAQAALLITQLEQENLQTQLSEQAYQLSLLQITLQNQQSAMLEQQKRIDALVGVRSEIIHSLSAELAAANLRASVDETTGDIMLESTIFFDSNSKDIKESGKALLDEFLPVYLGVLMRPEYIQYIGEIIIEGHTDSSGTYESNLRLSQNRALSVAEYCLQMSKLTYSQKLLLQELMTATGRSESDLIYDEYGRENQEASRRVEFKFRLKDSEMIEEMNQLLLMLE